MMEIKLDLAALGHISAAVADAALNTMEAVKTDLVSSQTVPFDTGQMQGTLHTEQFWDGGELHTPLQTDGPQARRLYYHPEYNFQKGNNPNAGAAWYAPYEAGGGKEKLIPDILAGELKKRLGE